MKKAMIKMSNNIMKKTIKYAFTLTEIIIVILIAGLMALLTTMAFSNISKNVDIVKLKNSNLNFKSGLSNMITNPVYYSSELGFADLSTVEIEKEDGSAKEVFGDKDKFRHLLYKELEIDKYNPIKCYLMIGSKAIKQDNCYKSENGIVWGVPETNFTTLNIVEAKNASGLISKYVPVTIYPDEKNVGTEENFTRKAVVIGVRSDGDATILNTVDCEEKLNKECNQCKYINYLF